MSDVRVLVVSDDPLARAGLAALLADQPGCLVVGRASTVEDLAAVVAAYRPDVILWDAGPASAAASEQLAASRDELPPVALLLAEAATAGEAWAAGARGLLRREAEPPQIAATLTALTLGLTVIDPEFVPFVLLPSAHELPGPAETPEPLLEELTLRELEVLRLLADGLPNKTIARRLGISEHTVKFHVNAILGKLGAASRTEAVVRATRLGLILL
ncbi:MAG: LuxR C-terminal-related transcriptional regulator [Anaerolineae bacterium]